MDHVLNQNHKTMLSKGIKRQNPKNERRQIKNKDNCFRKVLGKA